MQTNVNPILNGHVFFRDNGKCPCQVEIDDSSIRILTSDSNSEDVIPWGQVIIKVGGAADKLIIFTVLDSSKVQSFYVDKNKANLAVISSFDVPPVQSLFSEIQNKKMSSLKLWVGFICAGTALILMILLARDPLVDFVVDKVPYEWEQNLGERLVGLTIPAQNLVSSGDEHRQLVEQMHSLVTALPEEMQNVKVFIAKSSEINAFALPGGFIVFNEGLLKSATSIEEVLGVAAHELAHVTERHVLRSLVQAIGLYVVMDFIMGDMTGILAVIGENSQLLLQTGFSREQEFRADHTGFDLLVKAGIDPRGLISFFKILQDDQESKLGVMGELNSKLDFLSTHPATGERIEEIKIRLEREQIAFKKIDFDYDKFLAEFNLNK